MHILYVLPKWNYFTEGRRGRVAHALGVIGGLRANGSCITVVSGPETNQVMREWGDVKCIEIADLKSRLFREWRWNNRLIAAIRHEIKNDSVDAVVVRYGVSNAFRFWSLFRRSSQVLRCFEVNSLAFHQYHSLPMLVRRVFRYIELWFLQSADLIYAVSSALASDLVRRGRGGPKVIVIPNAAHVRQELLDGRARAAGDEPAPVKFVYMGVFQRYYELDLVIKSFRLANNRLLAVELHLYGDGPQYEAIREMAVGSEHIFLHGRYDLNALLSSGVLDEGTVLLLPNRGKGMSEIGSPIKLYEYMSFGLPILASAVAQATEVLQDGETCIFYEPGNHNSCVEAMVMLAHDAELRRKLGENVMDCFLVHHTWEARMAAFRTELKRLQETRNK